MWRNSVFRSPRRAFHKISSYLLGSPQTKIGAGEGGAGHMSGAKCVPVRRETLTVSHPSDKVTEPATPPPDEGPRRAQARGTGATPPPPPPAPPPTCPPAHPPPRPPRPPTPGGTSRTPPGRT